MEFQLIFGEIVKEYEQIKATLESKIKELHDNEQEITKLKHENKELSKSKNELEDKLKNVITELLEKQDKRIKQTYEVYKTELIETGKLDKSFDLFMKSINGFHKNDWYSYIETVISHMIRIDGCQTRYKSFATFVDGVRLFDGDENIGAFSFEHPVFFIPKGLQKLLNKDAKYIYDSSCSFRRALIYLYCQTGQIYLVFRDSQKSYYVILPNYCLDKSDDLPNLIKMRNIMDEYNRETITFLSDAHNNFIKSVQTTNKNESPKKEETKK